MEKISVNPFAFADRNRTCQWSWHLFPSDTCTHNQSSVMGCNCQKGCQYALNTSSIGLWNYFRITEFNHLSESKTKCWLSGSCSAYARSLFSASTIDILPHKTWMHIYSLKILPEGKNLLKCEEKFYKADIF